MKYCKKNKTLADILVKNNNNFDLLRLFAALMVIYSHSFVLAIPNSNQDIFKSMTDGLTSSGSIAVKFFFFLSGMLVANSLMQSCNIGKFILSRFFRIYPAFVFVIIISAVVIGPVATTLSPYDYFKHDLFYDYILKNIGMNINYFLPGVFEENVYKNAVNGSLWTIPFEIAAYLLLLTTFILSTGNKEKILSIVCLSIIILPFFNIGEGLFYTKENLAISPLPGCFALGVLFSIHKERIVITPAIPFAFFILYYLSTDLFLKSQMLYFFISTFFVYVSSLNTIKRIHIKYDISYGVYLWGFVVQQTIYHYLPNLHLYMNQILSIAISILLALPTYILVEKPAMNLGRRLSTKYFQNN